MNNKILPILVIFMGLFMALNLMLGASSTQTSPISHIVKWIGLGLAVFAFVKPKVGLYLVAVEAFTTDLVKKIAVYYGNASTLTIIEVMYVVMVALLATYAGRLVQSIFGIGRKPSKIEWAFYIVGMLIAFAVFFAKRHNGFVSAGQSAFNSGVYLGAGGLAIGLLETKKDIMKYLNFILFFAFVWALWAIKQSFFGFSDLEWHYASTGLSPVATNQMYLSRYEEPRAFGLGSGATNFNMMSAFALLSFWLFSTQQKNRILYLVICITIYAAIVLAKGKGNIVMAAGLPLLYYAFRTKRGTISMWSVIMIGLGCLILFSEYLIDNLETINSFVLSSLGLSGEWSILTFAERLKGYSELKNLENWTITGGVDADAHDTISKTLFSFGILGVFGILAVVASAFFLFHGLILKTPKGAVRNLAAMAGAATVGLTVKSLMGGSGLLVQPIPFVIGIMAGIVCVSAAVSAKATKAGEVDEDESLIKLPTASKVVA